MLDATPRLDPFLLYTAVTHAEAQAVQVGKRADLSAAMLRQPAYAMRFGH